MAQDPRGISALSVYRKPAPPGPSLARPFTFDRPPRRGVLGTVLDYLARPDYAVSEAVQAAGAGEDVVEAMWRGLQGKPKYPSLGYAALTPEARKAAAAPGVQAGDVAAFADHSQNKFSR